MTRPKMTKLTMTKTTAIDEAGNASILTAGRICVACVRTEPGEVEAAAVPASWETSHWVRSFNRRKTFIKFRYIQHNGAIIVRVSTEAAAAEFCPSTCLSVDQSQVVNYHLSCDLLGLCLLVSKAAVCFRPHITWIGCKFAGCPMKMTTTLMLPGEWLSGVPLLHTNSQFYCAFLLLFTAYDNNIKKLSLSNIPP